MQTAPAIRTSHFGAQAVAVGAAALARWRVTRPLDVQRIERGAGRRAATTATTSTTTRVGLGLSPSASLNP
jgi:hypothetical protein